MFISYFVYACQQNSCFFKTERESAAKDGMTRQKFRWRGSIFPTPEEYRNRDISHVRDRQHRQLSPMFRCRNRRNIETRTHSERVFPDTIYPGRQRVSSLTVMSLSSQLTALQTRISQSRNRTPEISLPAARRIARRHLLLWHSQ